MLFQKMAHIKVDTDYGPSILNLPELALESILERLSPADLCNMACVCRTLRERCRSDHLWDKYLKKKWGGIIGQAAYKEWLLFTDLKKVPSLVDGGKSKGWLSFVHCLWNLSWFRTKMAGVKKATSALSSDSIMNLFLSLQTGIFWFPAQVFNREGDAGFMLSCYDAMLSYDPFTNTFHARFPSYGLRPVVIEEGIEWDRIRAPPNDTLPHSLHVSDCLNDLHPGDHIEVQWRRHKELPYGWWYGVVGHLQRCDGNNNLCRCSNSDYVILEFNQYSLESRWRNTIINRKNHRQEGNEEDGFYGGIRKLNNTEEISMWKKLWPDEEIE